MIASGVGGQERQEIKRFDLLMSKMLIQGGCLGVAVQRDG
jgi:hypothetical protein